MSGAVSHPPSVAGSSARWGSNRMPDASPYTILILLHIIIPTDPCPTHDDFCCQHLVQPTARKWLVTKIVVIIHVRNHFAQSNHAGLSKNR